MIQFFDLNFLKMNKDSEEENIVTEKRVRHDTYEEEVVERKLSSESSPPGWNHVNDIFKGGQSQKHMAEFKKSMNLPEHQIVANLNDFRLSRKSDRRQTVLRNLSISTEIKKSTDFNTEGTHVSLLIEHYFQHYLTNLEEMICLLMFKWSWKFDRFNMPDKMPEKLSLVMNINEISKLLLEINDRCQDINIGSPKTLANKYNWTVLVLSMVTMLMTNYHLWYYTLQIMILFILADILFAGLIFSLSVTLFTKFMQKNYHKRLIDREKILQERLDSALREKFPDFLMNDFVWTIGKYGTCIKLKYPSIYADYNEDFTQG